MANLIKKTDKILLEIKSLKTTIIEQIIALQELESGLKDESLKECVNNIKKEMVDNFNGISSNESFFEEIRKNLFSALEKIRNSKKINNQYMEKKKELENKFQGSLNTMLEYFKKFQEKQGKVYEILKSKDEKKLKQLCEDQKNNEEDNNQDVKDAYQDLSDLLDQQQKQKQQQENGEESQANGSNQNMHFDLSEEEMERYSERIEKQNKEWIEKIENRKNSEEYDPSELLNELFKSFLGEDRDFYNRETQKNNGNTPRNW